MDHPAINNNPFIRLRIQQAFNPGGGASGVDQSTYFGVAYSTSSGRWSIETQDLGVPLQIGLRFLVAVGASDLIHDAIAGNTSGSGTEIDDVDFNGADLGFWSATYFRTREGSSGPRNPHPLAMKYDSSTERWSVVNQDSASLPFGGGFYIWGRGESSSGIISTSPFFERHRTASDNSLGSATFFDLDEINNRPNSYFFVTLDATSGALNPRPVAVAYNDAFGQWSIYNVDGTDMPIGLTYMINIVQTVLLEDGFESGGLDAWSDAVN